MTNTTHFINGKWLAGDSSAASFDSTNPATGEVLWSGNEASAELVNEAVQVAENAFKSWSMTTLESRIEILKRYQELLKENQLQIATDISNETGKQLWEAKTEAAAMVGKVDLSISSYEQRTGTNEKEVAGSRAVLTHRPHGVLAVLGPYNFPGHLPNGHIVPALIAGNTIVYKPSEITPLVGQRMVELLEKAGVPAGVVNLVQGGGSTGQAVSANDDIDGLLFTGSSRTGAAIHKQFGGDPGKLLALEMGGNNPLIYTEVEDTKGAVYNAIQSAFITSGQRCTCARRLIVLRNHSGKQFVETLVAATKDITVAMPNDDPEAFYGPVVSNQVADMMMSVQQRLIDQGGVSLVEMQRPDADKPLLTPAIIDVTDVDDLEDEEYFGPLLQITWVDTLDDAIELANNTRYGLAAGMLTDNDDEWHQFYTQIRAGIVNRNRPTTGASGGAPFGGVGASGNHRPSAYYAADYCAYPMASMLDDTAVLPEKLTPGIKL